ncbi:hypothetical protein ACVWZR_008707 [Bradyrhizobium sp. i1.3.1]
MGTETYLTARKALPMNEELKTLLSHPTASIPDVGRVCFGLARQGQLCCGKDRRHSDNQSRPQSIRPDLCAPQDPWH